MATLLQLNSSLFGDDGRSSRLADAFVERWRERNPGGRVMRRDLSESTVPHLTQERFAAALTVQEERTAEQTREAAQADALIDELLEADVLVIGIPVYNFNVPSTLKAWFDHVARAGTTFRYTPEGPQGLLAGKRAYVFATSGGKYSGTAADFYTPYVKHFLGFLGIDDVEFTYAEGLAMGEETSRAAIEAASRRIEVLAA
ncbi:MAG TPA: NAD(P)H-dependent oxidoreductase [Gammaproteobacteria bacterium]|nr:NAD(P)H-dependent oxidoreductase [Gammaproteobacteria bacterium]